MENQIITQFVGFATNMNIETFAREWERYTQSFKGIDTTGILYSEKRKNTKAFGYISKIEWPQDDYNSTLAGSHKNGRFSENKARGIELGGYTSIEEKRVCRALNSDATIIAFISHNENDIHFYEGLPFYSQIIIYQAYYENCNYGYIIVFTVPEAGTEVLLQKLLQRPGVEASQYGACLQPHL